MHASMTSFGLACLVASALALPKPASLKRDGSISWNDNCNDDIPTTSKFYGGKWQTKKDLLQLVYSDAKLLAEAGVKLSKSDKAFTHYFTGNNIDTEYTAFNRILKLIAEETRSYELKIEASGTGGRCSQSSWDRDFDVDIDGIHVCSSFWAANNEDVILLVEPTDSGSDSSEISSILSSIFRTKDEWCTNDSSHDESWYSTTPGRLLLEELVILDAVEQAAGHGSSGQSQNSQSNQNSNSNSNQNQQSQQYQNSQNDQNSQNGQNKQNGQNNQQSQNNQNSQNKPNGQTNQQSQQSQNNQQNQQSQNSQNKPNGQNNQQSQQSQNNQNSQNGQNKQNGQNNQQSQNSQNNQSKQNGQTNQQSQQSQNNQNSQNSQNRNGQQQQNQNSQNKQGQQTQTSQHQGTTSNQKQNGQTYGTKRDNYGSYNNGNSNSNSNSNTATTTTTEDPIIIAAELIAAAATESYFDNLCGYTISPAQKLINLLTGEDSWSWSSW